MVTNGKMMKLCEHNELFRNPGVSSECGNCGDHPIWFCHECNKWVDKDENLHSWGEFRGCDENL
jgi:predicted RNA-binding Zn-ribbon protein involved in translation (DUF1610 family)